MHESMISTSKVVATALWVAVTALLVTGWVIVLAPPEHPQLAMGFFSTACATSAMAAVLHIRCYFVRMGHLLRASNRVSERDGEPYGVRPVPRQTAR